MMIKSTILTHMQRCLYFIRVGFGFFTTNYLGGQQGGYPIPWREKAAERVTAIS